MQYNFNDIEYLIGTEDFLKSIFAAPAKCIFDDSVVSMLGDWSELLLKHPLIRQYQDVAAFAFWIRKKSLLSYKKEYQDAIDRMGRGLAFQIAPSNIPVQFAVTLVYALLSGNASVIRLSSKMFVQVDILCETLNRLLAEKYVELKKYVVIIKYDYSNTVTKWLSEECDIRIIWGGNQTINAIRKYSIAPRTIELTFADRYSIAVINSDEYIMQDAEKIAQAMYLDTYFVDQNACSSPRMIIWYGNYVDEAKKSFWSALSDLVEEKYTFQPISATNKLLQFCLLASEMKDVSIVSQNNKVVRIELQCLDSGVMKYKGNSGYFFEYVADGLEDVTQIITKECQTISCIGVDKNKLRSLIQQSGIKGGDRIVDFGHVLDLSLIWDGYDMIRELSRIIQN